MCNESIVDAEEKKDEGSSEGSQLLPLVSSAAASSENDLILARKLLYISHLAATFADRFWQFCVVLFLAAFSNYESLFLVSTFGLCTGLCTCYFGSSVGRFVDNSNHSRLFIARRFILAQNLCVLLASIFCYLVLSKNKNTTATDLAADDHDILNDGAATPGSSSSLFVEWLMHRVDGIPPLDMETILLLVGIHVLGSISDILSKGFTVAIERDWVVIMSQFAAKNVHESCNNDEKSLSCYDVKKEWLSNTNVAMRQIDLCCKVAAPAIAGFVLAAFDNDGSDPDRRGSNLGMAALIVGLSNSVALCVEYVCTKHIYRLIPTLAIREPKQQPKSPQQIILVPAKQQEPKEQPKRFFRLSHGLQVYFDQSVVWGGVGLSLLYLNVLCFGGIMTAYLVWKGMTLETVGIWRAIAAVVDLSGTFCYQYSVKKTSLFNTGMWSIVYQFLFLSISYASLFVDNDDHYELSTMMLILGVCASRIGLWVFDITVTQLMQEYVEDGVRGIVGGVQQSQNSFFSLLSFILGIVFPDPKTFFVYVAVGYASVGIANIVYGVGVYRIRHSLVPTI